MYYLLIGFIAPAVVFAILGLLVCIRRGSMNFTEEDKEYQSIDSYDDNLRIFGRRHKISAIGPSFTVNDESSYQMMYLNNYHQPLNLPPSYSEATQLRHDILCNFKSKHLPPNQPRLLCDRVLPQKSLPPDY